MGASEVGDVAVLEGGPGADELDGGVGFDIASFAGSASAVTGTVGGPVSGGDATGDTGNDLEGLIGSGHDDTLTGDERPNVLRGGAGDDVLAGLGGDDTLMGGPGMDRADYSAAGAAVAVDLSTPSAQPTGAGSDTLRKIENVTGSSFDDELSGGPGINRLEGGSGDDVLTGLDGADTLDGGDGVDLASYTKAPGAVVVDLAIAGAQDTVGAGLDTLISIEDLAGSPFGDELVGDAGPNDIGGRGGGDTLDGRDGDDRLVGAMGNDTLTGGPGTDSCYGGPGSNTITECEVTGP
jgi:Ca2+-binding RTX toxin-like protein